ncbi:hypothetical protein COB57_04930 [Candidatus Peregrinibacteria bacterium]|nr:MAG: hypothetical protein COB57_04930 [Candidatus Peregrinibacteria bacterium]
MNYGILLFIGGILLFILLLIFIIHNGIVFPFSILILLILYCFIGAFAACMSLVYEFIPAKSPRKKEDAISLCMYFCFIFCVGYIEYYELLLLSIEYKLYIYFTMGLVFIFAAGAIVSEDIKK